MRRQIALILLVAVLVVGVLVSPLVYSPPASAASVTFYTSSSDACLIKEDTTYSTAVEAASAGQLDASSTILKIGQWLAEGWYSIRRSVLYFDTSSIPDDATIASATLKIYGAVDNSYTDFNITIQEGMPTYPHDPAVVGDYNYMYYTGNGGTLSTASFSTGAYNSITLNSTGLTWINKTGTTKLMLRSSRDISGTAPTGAEYINVYSYEQGSGYRPKLEITYISAPDITTVAASNVAGTTARLNSTVVDDGGEACEVQWGWDDDSHPAATSTDDYEFNTSFAGSYTTGQKPYYDISDLNTSDDYYFRVEIQNSEDTELGGELSFTTSSGVGDPSEFRAYPSATSVSLTWVKGVGATNSIVRYRSDTYPTTYTDGELVYQGTSTSCTHSDLESGHTYYYAVWGESGGVYSDNSAEVMVTTSAAEVPGEELEVPGSPWHWLTGMDYTNMSNLPFDAYDTINAVLDTVSIPRATGWMMGALLASLGFGFFLYWGTKGSFTAGLAGMEGSMVFFWVAQLLPLYMPILGLIALIAPFMFKKREAYG